MITKKELLNLGWTAKEVMTEYNGTAVVYIKSKIRDGVTNDTLQELLKKDPELRIDLIYYYAFIPKDVSYYKEDLILKDDKPIRHYLGVYDGSLIFKGDLNNIDDFKTIERILKIE